MKRIVPFAVLCLVAAIGAWSAVSGPAAEETPVAVPPEGDALVGIVLPDTLSPRAIQGEVGFQAICASCHGDNGVGRNGMGPPLIHRIYEPSHHGDESFQLAVKRGVRAHHWQFGDMPPVSGLTRADVTSITTFIREIQRANGIF